MMWLRALPLCLLSLSACSSDVLNGTSFEPERASAREHVAAEYGTAPAVPVAAQVSGQTYQFLAQVSDKHPRILIKPTAESDEATAGAASRYSMGLIQRSRDVAPYEAAALQHLQAIGRKDCRMRSSAQFNRIGVEFTYECAPVPAPKT